MVKVTFKKEPRMPGLMGVGFPYQSVNIKINKKAVGVIHAPNWQSKDSLWGVSFSVMKAEPDDNPNCNWKWIHLKKRFADEETARGWVKSNIEEVAGKYTFYYMDE